MTFTEDDLKQFLETLNSTYEDEWYCSDRDAAEKVFEWFEEYMAARRNTINDKDYDR